MTITPLLTLLAAAPLTLAQAPPDFMGPPNDWVTIHNEGAVDVDDACDTSNLSVPRFQIHEMLAIDAIPTLTDPDTVPLDEAAWLTDADRLIYIAIGTDTLAVPIRVINWHEVIQTEIGGEPVAITYCPPCDSVAVVSRRVSRPAALTAASDPARADDPMVLDFGVTGALFNSNAIFYDEATRSLWSQLGMEAISGPFAGTRLRHHPFRLLRTPELRDLAPATTRVVTPNTGYERPYDSSPYDAYFADNRLIVPVWFLDGRLPGKTLGLCIADGDQSWFVPASDLIERELEVATPSGPVRVTISTAGVMILEAPENVSVAQGFFFAWAAFHQGTTIVRADPG
ncbi:MAG: DUF3179 domain-containing protein [Phycisphaerales bacterium]|nr:DUF3179 domain-containing protein [Phycisphaerales bacterium]